MTPYTIWQKIVVVLLIVLFGLIAACQTLNKPPQTVTEKITIKTSEKADWLLVVGAVVCAMGVYSWIAGNSAGVNIIAAGVTLASLGLLISTVAGFLAEYRGYLVFAFVVLGVFAFFIFARSYLDLNRDGKTDWQDVTALFTKFRFTKK